MLTLSNQDVKMFESNIYSKECIAKDVKISYNLIFKGCNRYILFSDY